MNPIIEELRREAKFSLASWHLVRLLLRAAEAVEAAEARADQAERFVERCRELGAMDTDDVKHALEDQARIRAELSPLEIECHRLRDLLQKAERPTTTP